MSTTSGSSNGVIQADLTGGADGTVKTGWSNTTTTTTITNTTQQATKTHNGVTWTYNNPAAASSTGRQSGEAQTDNSITIEGKVNIYKAMSGTTGYQTYINNAPTARADEGKVTVKITLVPNTVTASSAKK